MQEGSYLLIERGMPVRGTDGDLGAVEQLVADAGVDVFRGIVVAAGFLAARKHFLAAEHVISVSEGVVHADITRAEADALPELSAGGASLT